MAEWHLSPDYIISNWTDELLDLMIEKLVERKQQESDAIKGKHRDSGANVVSDKRLFSAMGKTVKVIKHGN